jgi:hypothetical protein
VITEHLMRPGSGTLQFVPEIPMDITQRILALIQGVGCHVVITDPPTDPVLIGDTATLSIATQNMRVVGRPSRLSLSLRGLSSWLDSYNDLEIARTAGTPTNWLTDLLVNGLVAGTVSGGSNVTRLFPAWGQTRREALDVAAGLGGWEYEVRPNFAVNAGTSVWSTTPTVVITDRNEGPDGALTGLLGGLLDQEITIADQATKVGALAQGDGPGIAVGQATQTIPLRDRNGNTTNLVTVISAPSEARTNAGALAANFLALRKLKRSVKVSTTTPRARRVVRPGDYVWLYDVKSGLVDTANQVFFRGEYISPIKVRVTSMTSPIEAGSGVYIRSNAASPEYIDVTRWVAWEPPGAFLDVGEWSPPVYGRANRSNPEIEERLANRGRVDWTPTVTQGVGIGLTVNRGWYVQRPDGTWLAKAKVTCTSAGTAGQIIQIGTPFTMADAADSGGSIVLLDNGTAFRVGNLGEDTTTTAAMYREGDGGKFSAVQLVAGDILRFTMTGSY